MRKGWTLFLLAGLLLVTAWWYTGDQGELAELRFFDVGQGDASLLQAGRWQALIDIGPDDGITHHLGRAMPWGDTHIETVIITHQHADHYRGLRSVLAHYRIGRLLIAPGTGDHEYVQVLQAASDDDVPVEQLAAPAAIEAPAGISVTVRPPATVSTNPNDRSLVIFITVGSTRVLLTGDAEEAAERLLVRSGQPLAADILKAGHHGSRTSSTPAFLEAVKPKVAVISCGWRNRYGHPAATTLANFTRVGSLLYRTDQNGTIRVSFTATRYRITAER